MKLHQYLIIVCLSLCACNKGKTMQQIAIEVQKHQLDSIHSLIEKEYVIERDSFSEGIQFSLKIDLLRSIQTTFGPIWS